LRAFQGDMVFELSDGHFAATRKLANGPGEETFTGTATSMGDILVTGVGGGRNGSTWNYEFHGTRDDKSDTKNQRPHDSNQRSGWLSRLFNCVFQASESLARAARMNGAIRECSALPASS
jgi:hypothetical protein